MKTLIIIGGFYCLAFFIFHLFFWKLFDWKHDLSFLTEINRGVIQILNLCLMFVFLVIAYVSLFYTDELLTSSLGKILLVGISIFCLLRAVEQVVFFGLKSTVSIVFFITFLLGSTIYMIPLLG